MRAETIDIKVGKWVTVLGVDALVVGRNTMYVKDQWLCDSFNAIKGLIASKSSSFGIHNAARVHLFLHETHYLVQAIKHSRLKLLWLLVTNMFKSRYKQMIEREADVFADQHYYKSPKDIWSVLIEL
jgi:hypothetical protein